MRIDVFVLGILLAFSNVAFGQANKIRQNGSARLNADKELQITLPLLRTLDIAARQPQFRALAFANMSTRSLDQDRELNDTTALFVRESPDGIAVQRINSPQDSIFSKQAGLLIWRDRGKEYWKFHLPPDQRTTDKSSTALVSVSRSSSAGIESVTIGTATNPLAQLAGMPVGARGAGGFISPMGEMVCLNPDISLRRSARDDGSFPELQVTLWRGSIAPDQKPEKLTDFSFPKGHSKMKWSEIEGLPASLSGNLPKGTYSLTVQGSKESVDAFDVVVGIEKYEDNASYLESMIPDDAQLPTELKVLLGVESLLSFTGDHGMPTPLYCDALDWIDRIPEENLGPGFKAIRHQIALKSGNATPVELDDYPTGIETIDDARALIAKGNWSDAKSKLSNATDSEAKRFQGLRSLYLAVIEAESGATNREQADVLYRKAIDFLADEQPSDAWRAYNNYGVFLMNQSQDLLNNHAFQIATGVRGPLSSALLKWQEAADAFHYADFVAEKTDPATRANVQVNQARLYAILADILATFSLDDSGSIAQRERLADRARNIAARYSDAAGQTDGIDPLLKGCTSEILAQLAFRAEDWQTSKRRADEALDHFLDAASLAGAESVLRLKGMIELAGDDKDRELGLHSLQVSSRISDILYDRIPGDKTGRSKAGFFSRRAYVSARIVEELIGRGETELAADYAEEAKARSLKEILASRSLQTAAENAEQETRWVGEIASDFPDGTVALEYFIGPENCFAFLITKDGVEAQQLTHPDGSPLASRDLVASVVTIQSKMGHQAKKMLARIHAGQEFDHSWQDDLHQLYRQLIPAKFVEKVHSAKSLVIVPQHVLHYVPFAALVTKLDANPNHPDRPKHYEGQRYGGMAQPRFLIDEGVNITVAPSLASWDLIRNRNEPIKSASAVGIAEFPYANPLPGVKKDLQNFRQIFGEQVREILPGVSASEDNARKMLSHPGVLLFATHGVNLADNPLESFLLCHESADADGRLTAGEVFQTEVKADMIVMSACYSGLADRSPIPGDDLFGLQRSFLVAGSSTVVSGLWDVYDGTGPTLMKDFFERFQSGTTADESLAGTQRAFLEKLRKSKQVEFFLHPYFWSVYNVAGDGSLKFE